MNWRLIPRATGDAAWNMAADEYMAEEAKQESRPVLRFYRWDPPALSIGYFQKFSREVNEEGCRELGIQWIRRPTGGRAVLHEHEITYCLALPLDYPQLPQGVTNSYRWLSAGLLQGLKELGVEAEFAPVSHQAGRGKTAACFDSPSRYELLVGGRKVVGSAQVRRDGVLLQHGSVLLDFDLERLLQVMRFSNERRRDVTRRLLAGKAGSLKPFLDPMPGFDTLASSLAAGFEDSYQMTLTEIPLSHHEKGRIECLRREKYQTEQWNRRS